MTTGGDNRAHGSTKRIGINAIFRPTGGSLNHLRNVLWHLSRLDQNNEYVILTTPQGLKKLGRIEQKNFRYVTFVVPGIAMPLKLIWEQALLPLHAAREGLDVLFCPGNISPLFSPVRTVVMLQNAGPFCSGITVKEVGVYSWVWFKLLGPLTRFSAQRADYVLFVSNYLKDYFVKEFGFPEWKGEVVYLGRPVNGFPGDELEQSLAKQFVASGPYVLFVSHLYRYKNVLRLIEGFRTAIGNLADERLRLLIVGRAADRQYFAQIVDMVKKYGLQERVLLVGELPQQELFPLYKNCACFAFPSICESFGSVLLEALSSGAPIACSKLGVMPEICRDAAVYFDPYDSNDIAEKILLVVKDKGLREALSQRAVVRAQEFPDWAQVAEETLRILIQVAGG